MKKITITNAEGTGEAYLKSGIVYAQCDTCKGATNTPIGMKVLDQVRSEQTTVSFTLVSGWKNPHECTPCFLKGMKGTTE